MSRCRQRQSAARVRPIRSRRQRDRMCLASTAYTDRIVARISVKLVPPTGQYTPTKLINYGTNRWAVKPELGYSTRWEHWTLDAYGGAWFFTTNADFFSYNEFFRRECTVTTSSRCLRGAPELRFRTAPLALFGWKITGLEAALPSMASLAPIRGNQTPVWD
jgi:Putative MetA-pathway of phenol degradation